MDKDKWFSQLPLLSYVHQEEVDIHLPFEQIAAGFARQQGTVVLLSGTAQDCSRYNILAADTWLAVQSFKNKVVITHENQKFCFKTDIFDFVRGLTDHFRQKPHKFDLPVSCGLFGYLSYDLKDRIEKLPRTCMDTHLPDFYMVVPRVVLVEDKKSGKRFLSVSTFAGQGCEFTGCDDIAATKNRFFRQIDRPPAGDGQFEIANAGFTSSFTKAEYIDAVNRIIAYLKAGDIYQANFSQRFEVGFSGDAYALFLDLFSRNPASFFSYINAGNHIIVSTSPERFIKQRDRNVETRPIKGTISRSHDPVKDEANRVQLINSIKDDAELTMIVDLMRNDLSRVTEPDSVVVTEHKRLEPYENVYHLVSIVRGVLQPGKSSVDLIEATFPGGSITGCPKIRSMEIIDELEPVKRHIYTGSIGYISFHDTMDLSIAIRTATLFDNKVCFSVGGGIVYDSDPQKEYQETLDKGKTLMEALSGSRTTQNSPQLKAWLNGKICSRTDMKVSVYSEGFQYGAGIFETIKVSGGRFFFLDEHVSRMNQAWIRLFDQNPPDITWEDVISLLIRENGFQDQDLCVKIMLAKNKPGSRHPHMAVTAEKYVHRLAALEKPGLDLMIYPHARHSMLADDKTMNYLFYQQAKAYVQKRGADEAIILNADRSLSETNTANLIAIDGQKLIVPGSAHRLAGITLEKTLNFLVNTGYEVIEKTIPEKEICRLKNVIVTNSLMGAVRVLSIDGCKVEHDFECCEMINKKLFNNED